MKISLFLLLASLCNKILFAQEFEGGCLKPTTSRVPSNVVGSSNQDHAAILGGVSNIDKITEVSVRFDCFPLSCFFGSPVVYRLKDGSVRRLSHGRDQGTLRTVKFGEDEYLTGIDFFKGTYVDNVRLFRNQDAAGFGPYGGSPGPNRSYKRDRSVIKAFHTAGGDVLDNLGVYFETNGLHERVGITNSLSAMPTVPSVFDQVSVEVPDDFSARCCCVNTQYCEIADIAV